MALPRDDDITTEVVLTDAEIRDIGAIHTVTVTGPEQQQTVRFRIPANVRHGQKIRLPRQGVQREDGTRSDLYIQMLAPPLTPNATTPPAKRRMSRSDKIIYTSVIGGSVIAACTLVTLIIVLAPATPPERTPAAQPSPAPSVTAPPVDTTCLPPEVVGVDANWRPPTAYERANAWKTTYDYEDADNVYLLDDVTVTLRNRSSERIWIRNVNIISRWTDPDGKKIDTWGPRYAGWYTSVVPRPRTSNDTNRPRWVSPGDTISFSRDFATSADDEYEDAESAITNGPKPATTVVPNSIDWWLDNEDTRQRCPTDDANN